MSIRLGRLLISEEALQKILDFLPYPFLVSRMKNEVSHVAYINHKFIEEIGYPISEVPTIVEWFQLEPLHNCGNFAYGVTYLFYKFMIDVRHMRHLIFHSGN